MKPAVKWTMIVGAALTLGGPMLGVLGTVIGMMSSFNTLGKSGTADTEALASDIGVTLMSTAGGIIIGGIGFLVIIVGLIIWLVMRKTESPPPLKT